MLELVHTISQRIARYLEKVGLVERDMESSYLNLPLDDEDSLLQLQGACVSYRIAMGPQQGKKVFTLQVLPFYRERSLKGTKTQNSNMTGYLEGFADIRTIEKQPKIINMILNNDNYLDFPQLMSATTM